MANIITPRRWQTKPPIGSQIDSGHPLAQGLTGCWLFNEAGGSVLRDLAGKCNGAITGATWRYSTPGGVLSFDGSDDVVTLTVPPQTFTEGQVSLCMVVNPNSQSNAYMTNGTSNDSNKLAMLFGFQAGAFNIFNNEAYPTGVAADTQIAGDVGAWQQIVYASDGARVFGYKSGSKMIDVAANLNVNGGNLVTFCIGGAAVASAPFGGLVSGFSVYNRALSPSEVRWLYEEPHAFVQPPVPYRRFVIPSAPALTTRPYYYQSLHV